MPPGFLFKQMCDGWERVYTQNVIMASKERKANQKLVTGDILFIQTFYY